MSGLSRAYIGKRLGLDRKTSQPRTVMLADESKLFELVKRGGFTLNISGRQQMEEAIRKKNCARHDFGSYVLSKTGNLKAVMDTMGHADVKIAMTYQHPELEIVRRALNSRHTGETSNAQVVD